MSTEILGAVLFAILFVFIVRSLWINRKTKYRAEITPDAGGGTGPSGPAISHEHRSGDSASFNDSGSSGDGGGGGD